MRKLLTTILSLAILVSVLTVSAAASFENSADDLNSLGLFLGTGDGYELDRAPKRDEAAIMLVRFLGKEIEAEEEEYEHPFTDVPFWADNAVGYLFEAGLTNGISSTEFGSTLLCDAQMYTTFMLRALGYFESEGDFVYEDAISFGKEIGIIDDILTDGEFLRGNMVAVSMLGLKAQPKDGSADTLLEKLIDEGAVSAEDAEPLLERFAAYDEYIAAVSDYNSATKMDVDVSMVGDMTMLGMEIPFDYDMCIQISVESDNLLMALTGAMYVLGEDIDIESYYKDGYNYTNSNGEKIKMAMDMSEALEQAGDSVINVCPLYAIKSIDKATSGGSTEYTIEYADGFLSDLVDSVMSGGIMSGFGIDEAGMSISINSYVETLIIDGDGALAGQIVDMDLDMYVDMDGETIEVGMSCSATLDVFAIGDSVVVSFPDDLDTYVEVE